MDKFIIIIPLLPLLISLLIGVGHLAGIFQGQKSERFIAAISTAAMSCVLLVTFLVCFAAHMHQTDLVYTAGIWLESEVFSIPFNFITHGFRLDLAVLFSLLLLFTIRFSQLPMRGEQGFYRFFATLNLFSSAILFFALSANLVEAFIGWEVAGVCAYLLIAYSYDNLNAVTNATRVFVTNRVGDIGFLLGIALTYGWIGSINWVDLNQVAPELETSEANILALCFATAALVKSAQIPFAAWLVRAMEGPLAASAILFGSLLIHAGVLLVIVLQPLFEQSALVMAILVVFGLLSAGYATLIGLTQTDVKSSLSYAILGQLGLMFVECGLNLWQLAVWHLAIHALFRCYQIINLPDFLQQTSLRSCVQRAPELGKYRWIYMVSLQGFWLDPLIDWALVDPTHRLSKDLGYFDEHIIDATMGSPAPAMNALSSLAQLEEQKIGAQLDNETDDFARGSGFAGKLAASSAWILHWIEERLVIQGMHEGTLSYGRQLGHITNKIEQLLIRPRYLSLFVFISLLAVF